MSRKDTILIAVIINAGLLVILFATAILYDSEQSQEQSDVQMAVVETPQIETDTHVAVVAPMPNENKDEMEILDYYGAAASPQTPVEEAKEIIVAPIEEEKIVVKEPEPEKKEFIEVTVKKGDALEKIARANGSTVSAIKKANQLKNEKLSIGQVLKIPQKNGEKSIKKEVAAASEKESSGSVYYTIKSGDSPWKIARQYNVNYEDILRINNLDEDKARNLKIGDKIRVK